MIDFIRRLFAKPLVIEPLQPPIDQGQPYIDSHPNTDCKRRPWLVIAHFLSEYSGLEWTGGVVFGDIARDEAINKYLTIPGPNGKYYHIHAEPGTHSGTHPRAYMRGHWPDKFLTSKQS